MQSRAAAAHKKVLVAMSGGVDSSVAALRLLRAGWDVIGVTLHLWDYPEDSSAKSRCCAPEDVHDARRVADKLGFPHYSFDRRELFASEVVDPFVEAYLDGQTPSPCVRCNRGVKFRELFRLADVLGAARVATGHYARLDRSKGVPELLRARDRGKDQSYFLHMLEPSRLERLLFPLGDSEKGEVRAEAQAAELPGAHKGESQELCFVSSGRYDAFVAQRAPARVRPGPIVDASGALVGEHGGVHGFTIGQRKKLGVALGERAYVVAIEPETATVRLGPESALAARSARLAEVTLQPGVTLPLRCEVQVRYRSKPVACEVRGKPGATAEVVFDTPLGAVGNGQYAVFYDGERVLGGGVITGTTAVAATTAELTGATTTSAPEVVA
jgi:tRNA-specific 2-thiouridylase